MNIMSNVLKCLSIFIITFCCCVTCYYTGYGDGKTEGYEQGRADTLESVERCNL